jgi:hypothetical protein
MATLQFYKNRYRYPHYINNLTPYNPPIPDVSPVEMNFKTGVLKVAGRMQDFMSCNYLSFTRDFVTIYAWIEDVKFHTENSFEVSYQVDAWRTYRSKINLGTQYIARRPQATVMRDKLLGSSTPYPEITSKKFTISSPNHRIFVVQTRTSTATIPSRTPVNPTPYQFYMLNYNINNWQATQPLMQLMTALSEGAESKNIVTMYSIPYMAISSLSTVALPIVRPNGETIHIDGFKFLGEQDPTDRMYIETSFDLGIDLDELMRVDHTVQLVIPEAGIISIPDEILTKPALKLRQDVDLFSGASNYMLVSSGNEHYTQSVRGSSISSIPIVSDPLETYLSQNQNALATSLIGDVATIVGGGAVAFGTGGVGAVVGGSTAMNGVNNIVNRMAGQMDMAHNYSNPPAFLGTALVSNFNQTFWVVVTRVGVENAGAVHSNFGYPLGLIDTLTFPSSGFIQTEGCAVTSTDGSVPKWALDEINSNFNNGILVHN